MDGKLQDVGTPAPMTYYVAILPKVTVSSYAAANTTYIVPERETYYAQSNGEYWLKDWQPPMTVAQFVPQVWSQAWLRMLPQSKTPYTFYELAEAVGCRHHLDLTQEVTYDRWEFVHDFRTMWYVTGDNFTNVYLFRSFKLEFQAWLQSVCPDAARLATYPDAECEWWVWHEAYGLWDPDMTPYILADSWGECTPYVPASWGYDAQGREICTDGQGNRIQAGEQEVY